MSCSSSSDHLELLDDSQEFSLKNPLLISKIRTLLENPSYEKNRHTSGPSVFFSTSLDNSLTKPVIERLVDKERYLCLSFKTLLYDFSLFTDPKYSITKQRDILYTILRNIFSAITFKVLPGHFMAGNPVSLCDFVHECFLNGSYLSNNSGHYLKNFLIRISSTYKPTPGILIGLPLSIRDFHKRFLLIFKISNKKKEFALCNFSDKSNSAFSLFVTAVGLKNPKVCKTCVLRFSLLFLKKKLMTTLLLARSSTPCFSIYDPTPYKDFQNQVLENLNLYGRYIPNIFIHVLLTAILYSSNFFKKYAEKSMIINKRFSFYTEKAVKNFNIPVTAPEETPYKTLDEIIAHKLGWNPEKNTIIAIIFCVVLNNCGLNKEFIIKKLYDKKNKLKQHFYVVDIIDNKVVYFD